MLVVLSGCSQSNVSPTLPIAEVTPSATPTSQAPNLSPTLANDTDWPTFAHDLARTSTQPGSSALTKSTVSSLTMLWAYRSAGIYDTASPIVAGGIVYAADASGNLAAISVATGKTVWTRSFGVEIKDTPALYDGYLFVGTFINTAGVKSTLYALDPATGTTRWSVQIPGGVRGSPVAYGGTVYVPVSLGDPGYCNPGGVYAFNEATGSAGLSWLTGGAVANDGGAVWSPLTYDGSRLLYGTGNTCVTAPVTSNAIVALSASLGFLWADQTANPFTDDDVGGGAIESGSLAYVPAKNGNVYAVNPSTGTIAWQQNLGAPDLYGSYTTPSLASDTLMSSIGYRYDPFSTQPMGTQFGALDGLDPATGAVRWQIKAVSPFYEPPAIVGGVAFTTSDSTILALDPQTGATLWTGLIETSSRSAVAIADDEVIVADSDGDLYAFGLPTAQNAAMRRATSLNVRIHPASGQFVNRIPRYCLLK